VRILIFAIALALAAAAAPLSAQAQGKAPAAPSPAAQAAPAPPDNYTYQAEGRRDPFLNLFGTATEPKQPARRGEGPASLALGEITVRGIMQSRDALVAMISGPDSKTYVVHPGERLLDGVIKSITAEGLVVLQRVNDPLSTIKQREVRKLLRSLEDGK